MLTLRVGRWETKDDLSTVRTGAETNGGGAAIFDRVREENESRSETTEWWLRKMTVLSLVSITERLCSRCVMFGELTELSDV